MTGLGRECLLPTLEIHIDLLLVKYFFPQGKKIFPYVQKGKLWLMLGAFSPRQRISPSQWERILQEHRLEHCSTVLSIC